MAWTIDGSLALQNLDVIDGNGRICLIECYDDYRSDEELMANARLIAAAPDLLAACEAMAAQLGGGDSFTQWEKAKADLREAIAKATGA